MNNCIKLFFLAIISLSNTLYSKGTIVSYEKKYWNDLLFITPIETTTKYLPHFVKDKSYQIDMYLEDGNPVGYIIYHIKKPTTCIMDANDLEINEQPELSNQGIMYQRESSIVYVSVIPHFRRRGIGTQLITNALEKMKAHGVTCVSVTMSEHNTLIREFFEKNGFTACDVSDWKQVTYRKYLPFEN